MLLPVQKGVKNTLQNTKKQRKCAKATQKWTIYPSICNS